MANSVAVRILDLIEGPPFWGWVDGMYLAGNDCGISLRIRNGHEYEPKSRELWRKLSRYKRVIDIGAHTGIYSLDAYKAGATEVISIEPYYLNFSRLVMNLRYNGFPADNAILCAVSSKNGTGTLSIPAPNHYCSAGCRLGNAENPQIGQFPVHIRRLDDLVREHSKIKAIKIDTEGHGVEILKGAPDILSYKPDMILECIEEGMTEILEPLGYRFFKIDETRGLERVERLKPDDPIDMNSPNRFATVGNSHG